ncbi:glycoside hydrolase family 5 protein [Olsenella sp. YH-ols2217]|uniref:cellulase n=2 Tax=Kribbibacterium absianum TaxID=3044210 RepID=A0ABT6ZK07_9ACTN|nr:glycoside hydrolase family 5 protein [Olsenella sp. YH-ols2217]MDJ1129397.1 glycoside hydrolase family 5 protein [Olsenella sp. YH-ols2217]
MNRRSFMQGSLGAALFFTLGGCASADTAAQGDEGIADDSDQSAEAVTSDNATALETVGGESTPVEQHGALSVRDGQLVDAFGAAFQLRGVSTHGLSWFPQFVSEAGFRTLRDDWSANCVRLSLYPDEEGGYCTGGDQGQLKQLVKNGVAYAQHLGMYVVIDWHVLGEQDPQVHQDAAIEFFAEMSAEFAGSPNVLYEVCNEPNGDTSWEHVTDYANAVIPTIRANAPDAVVIVGTPTWSQDIDDAQAAPLGFENLLYAVHFYAASHGQWLRDRVEEALNAKPPVIVSEFGMCDASGDGANDYEESQAWLDFLDEHDVSYIVWALADKDETADLVAAGSGVTSDWAPDQLSDSGRWVREQYRARQGK